MNFIVKYMLYQLIIMSKELPGLLGFPESITMTDLYIRDNSGHRSFSNPESYNSYSKFKISFQ